MTEPLIYPRSVWDPQYDDGDITLVGLANEVFVHHTVSAQLSPFASVEQEKEQMRVLEATGQSRFGTGISYNVLIFPSGRAYQGVSFNRRGTHTDGRNSTTRSICFVGNYEVNGPTDAQILTAQKIYHEGKGKWWWEGAPLYGHRDLKPTACPGKNVYAELPTIASPIVGEEEEMPSAKEIADAVWDEEMQVPPNLVDRFEERITMRRAVWATLSRAEAVLNELEEK